MARTVAGRRLTQQHRIAQVRLAVLVTREARELWPLLDPARLEETTPGWINALIRVIIQHRRASAELSRRYLQGFRLLETGAAQRIDTALSPLDVSAVATSLAVTGPVRIRRALRRSQPIERARNLALTESSRAAARHALNGGRELITQAVAADPRARGWVRVASFNACGFCTSLASRGAVFTEASGDFAAHDGCNCSAEPAYD